MVGCTPHDNVSYIFDAYCGSASVRQIIERSDFWKDKEEGQDQWWRNTEVGYNVAGVVIEPF